MDLIGTNGRKFSKLGHSLYHELELSKGASEADINRQYRKLALKFHPDKNVHSGTNTVEKFKQINRAHKILTDPQKRKIYDTRGSFGLFLLERVGEDNVGLYGVLSNWWCQGLVCFGAVLTGCYCCLCCCCCCGKCLPPEEEEIPEPEVLEGESQDGDRSSSSAFFTTTEQPRQHNDDIYTIPMP